MRRDAGLPAGCLFACTLLTLLLPVLTFLFLLFLDWGLYV